MSRGNQRRADPQVVKAQRTTLVKRIRKVFVLTATTGVILYAGWWLNGAMSVTSWKIEGNPSLKQAIAEQLEAMESRDFIHTRPELLSREWMGALPDLGEVQIMRVLPNALHIRATARVPIALWQDEKGRLQLVDRKGAVYRALQRTEAPDLPLLRVPESTLSSSYQLLGMLAKQNMKMITGLSEVRAEGDYWKVHFSKGVSWKLPFGKERESLVQISTLLKQPRWRNRSWQVDARQQTRWYIRPAKYGGVI